MGVLLCASPDGRHFTMRVTGQFAEYEVGVAVAQPSSPVLDIRHYPRHRSRDVLQLFPRARKGF